MDLPIPAPQQTAMPPFLIVHPARQTAPMVFASPHSGRNYSPEFQRAARLDPAGLRRSEDSFVDELFGLAPLHGAPLIAATFPRAYCDPNREPWELDPAMFDDILPSWVNTTSARVGAGLGTIARVVASGEAIYRGKLRFSDATERVQTCWQPYHAGLSELIDATRRRVRRLPADRLPFHAGAGLQVSEFRFQSIRRARHRRRAGFRAGRRAWHHLLVARHPAGRGGADRFRL